MEFRIQEMPAFRFAGVAARVPMQFEGENPAIARLAGEHHGGAARRDALPHGS